MINLTAMDMGLSIGFFALFALFGSLDYATVFSLAPFVNESAITIIGLLLLTGAMAKSAQIPLHSWLPGSMEGLKNTIYFYIILFQINVEEKKKKRREQIRKSVKQLREKQKQQQQQREIEYEHLQEQLTTLQKEKHNLQTLIDEQEIQLKTFEAGV